MTYAIIALALAGAVLLAAYLFQDRLVFFPLQGMAADPNQAGLEYEDARIETTDGLLLHGWYVPARQGRGTVLFCHGNAGNVSHRLETLEIIHGLGFSCLIFDYRGYGRSQGKPSERGLYDDVLAAGRWLRREKGVGARDLVLWGRSLGAAVAAYAAAKEDPAALILESAFTSVPEMGKKLYPFLPVKLIARIGFETGEHVAKVSCPVLVIHSPDDEIVPFEMGRGVFEAAPEPKRFMEIFGSHNTGFLNSGRSYVQGIEEFLNQAGI
jgi:fermentation-respiration switch protein FrsA (DUF1100 family)